MSIETVPSASPRLAACRFECTLSQFARWQSSQGPESNLRHASGASAVQSVRCCRLLALRWLKVLCTVVGEKPLVVELTPRTTPVWNAAASASGRIVMPMLTSMMSSAGVPGVGLR
jgi:hypothetical protein